MHYLFHLFIIALLQYLHDPVTFIKYVLYQNKANFKHIRSNPTQSSQIFTKWYIKKKDIYLKISFLYL